MQTGYAELHVQNSMFRIHVQKMPTQNSKLAWPTKL